MTLAIWDRFDPIPYLIAGGGAPEIAVTGNATNIADGDATPSLADHTDFGTITQGSPLDRTFVVSNSGTANLVISSVALSGAGAAQFSVQTDPTGTIVPSGTANLVVRAAASAAGTFAATVTINSNDGDEAAFDFGITVTVNASGGGSLRTSRTDYLRGTVFGVVRSVVAALLMFMNI